MRKFIYSILAVFSVSLFLVGCDNNNEEKTYTYFDQFMVYVKFVSPVGTNVVDSLGFLKNTEREEPFNPATDENIRVTCVRDSDGKPLNFWEPYWTHYFLVEEDWAHDNELKDGTLMRLFWSDDLIECPENAPSESYDQSYTVSFRSKKIFGDDNEHFIKWYVHVTGNRYVSYKCEIDGEEYAYKESSRYQHYHSRSNGLGDIGNLIIPMPVNP